MTEIEKPLPIKDDVRRLEELLRQPRNWTRKADITMAELEDLARKAMRKPEEKKKS